MNTTALVGTNGTPRAQIAVDRAATLAARTGAKLIVVSVVEAPAITTPIGRRGIEIITAVHRQRHCDTERAVLAGVHSGDALGVHTTAVIRSGDPVPTTLARAQHPEGARLPTRSVIWSGKLFCCPKLIIPLQIDRAMGNRRHRLWAKPSQASSSGLARDPQSAPAVRRRSAIRLALPRPSRAYAPLVCAPQLP
jgi:hypothetical protein